MKCPDRYGDGVYAMRKFLGLSECRAVPQSVLHLAERYGDGLEAIFKCRLPLNSETKNRSLNLAWYSPARIEQELGWQAQFSLEEGLREKFGR